MAPLPDVAKVLRVDCQFKVGSKPGCLTRFFVRYDGTAPTSAQLVTYAGSVRSAFNTNLKALMTSGDILTQVTCTDLSSVTGAQGADTTTVTGTRAGASDIASLATIISYTIARRFRGGHSRSYWPFGVNGDTATEQTFNPTFTAAVKTGIDAFFTSLLAAGWAAAGSLDHVAISYFTGSHVVTNPTTGRARNVSDLRATPRVDAVTARLVRTSLGHQRRRDRV